jgi:Cu+-exporting ATPase
MKYRLRDSPKENALATIKEIKKMGLEVFMLTGDNEKAANAIANEVGIDKVFHSLFPIEKADIIDKLHKENKIVIMAGDGINDTIALARSNIAIAMGNGADVAISVSDVVLMDEKPGSIYEAYKLSKRTFRAVKENLSFSSVNLMKMRYAEKFLIWLLLQKRWLKLLLIIIRLT